MLNKQVLTDEKYIKEATAHFEELLRSQLARCEKMAGDSGKTDFAALDKTVIGICDGDGIGPIIMKQAEKLLSVILSDEIAAGKAELRRIDGLTIENRLALGKSVPEDTLAAIKNCHVLLKG